MKQQITDGYVNFIESEIGRPFEIHRIEMTTFTENLRIELSKAHKGNRIIDYILEGPISKEAQQNSLDADLFILYLITSSGNRFFCWALIEPVELFANGMTLFLKEIEGWRVSILKERYPIWECVYRSKPSNTRTIKDSIINLLKKYFT